MNNCVSDNHKLFDQNIQNPKSENSKLEKESIPSLITPHMYHSSFSKHSLAIRINFETSLLKLDCVIPKSSKALLFAKSKASFIKETRFCSFSDLFHFSRNSSFSGVMLTHRTIDILTFFFLVIYKVCLLDIKTTFI